MKKNYNEEGRIIGLEGGVLQACVYAKKGEFFEESSVKKAELEYSARRELLRKGTKKEDELELFLQSKEKELGEATGFTGSAFRELKKAFVEPFKDIKSFYDKKIKTSVDKGFWDVKNGPKNTKYYSVQASQFPNTIYKQETRKLKDAKQTFTPDKEDGDGKALNGVMEQCLNDSKGGN